MSRVSTGDVAEEFPGVDTEVDTEGGIEVAMGTAPIVHVAGGGDAGFDAKGGRQQAI